MLSALRFYFRRACDHLDGPDGRLAFAAIFVALALALIAHDTYARIDKRRGR